MTHLGEQSTDGEKGDNVSNKKRKLLRKKKGDNEQMQNSQIQGGRTHQEWR